MADSDKPEPTQDDYKWYDDTNGIRYYWNSPNGLEGEAYHDHLYGILGYPGPNGYPNPVFYGPHNRPDVESHETYAQPNSEPNHDDSGTIDNDNSGDADYSYANPPNSLLNTPPQETMESPTGIDSYLQRYLNFINGLPNDPSTNVAEAESNFSFMGTASEMAESSEDQTTNFSRPELNHPEVFINAINMASASLTLPPYPNVESLQLEDGTDNPSYRPYRHEDYDFPPPPTDEETEAIERTTTDVPLAQSEEEPSAHQAEAIRFSMNRHGYPLFPQEYEGVPAELLELDNIIAGIIADEIANENDSGAEEEITSAEEMIRNPPVYSVDTEDISWDEETFMAMVTNFREESNSPPASPQSSQNNDMANVLPIVESWERQQWQFPSLARSTSPPDPDEQEVAYDMELIVAALPTMPSSSLMSNPMPQMQQFYPHYGQQGNQQSPLQQLERQFGRFGLPWDDPTWSQYTGEQQQLPTIPESPESPENSDSPAENARCHSSSDDGLTPNSPLWSSSSASIESCSSDSCSEWSFRYSYAPIIPAPIPAVPTVSTPPVEDPRQSEFHYEEEPLAPLAMALDFGLPIEDQSIAECFPETDTEPPEDPMDYAQL